MAEKKFKAIAQAYDTLKDSNKRAVYDKYGNWERIRRPQKAVM